MTDKRRRLKAYLAQHLGLPPPAPVKPKKVYRKQRRRKFENQYYI